MAMSNQLIIRPFFIDTVHIFSNTIAFEAEEND